MTSKVLLRTIYILFLSTVLFLGIPKPVYSQITDNEIQNIFLAGRGFGSSYYYLVDLVNKSCKQPYSDIKKEYENAFQSLNINDLIIDDLGVDDNSKKQLRDIRLNLYNALNKQDLSETKLAATIDTFTAYYNNLMRNIGEKYGDQGAWLLSLGFYTSFQLESINSNDKSKFLLSGFNKITKAVPFTVSENIKVALKNIEQLDKIALTSTDIARLKDNTVFIIESFSNYPCTKPLISEIQSIVGVWQGILLDPNFEKHDIRLNVDKSLSASMDIDNLAKNIPITNIELVDNYFTFMFKPFGTEKFYIKFNAKLSDNIFAGEVIDVIGDKGYWVLARTENSNLVSENKLDTMASYIKDIEKRLKNTKESSE